MDRLVFIIILEMNSSYEHVLQQNKLYYARQKLKGRTQLPPEAYSRTEIPELVSKY